MCCVESKREREREDSVFLQQVKTDNAKENNISKKVIEKADQERVVFTD